MGAQQCVFGCNGVYTAASFVVGFTYRFVDFGKFAPVPSNSHFIFWVAYDRESLVPLKFHTLVFVEYCLAVVVKFDDEPFGGLYGSNFYISVPDVAFLQIMYIRIPESGKATEQKDIPHPFKVLLCVGYLIIFEFVQFFPSEEYTFFGVLRNLGLKSS